MKKYKSTVSAVLVAVLLVPVAMIVSAPKAEAACSYQGYVSSGGKCAHSFKNVNKHKYSDDDEDDDDYYENRCRFTSSYYRENQYSS